MPAKNTDYCGVVKVTSLLVLGESVPGFSVFGVKAWTEMKIWCVEGIYLTCVSCIGVGGEALQLHALHKKLYPFTTSHLRFLISTTSHTRICIGYFVTCTASGCAMELDCMIK